MSLFEGVTTAGAERFGGWRGEVEVGGRALAREGNLAVEDGGGRAIELSDGGARGRAGAWEAGGPEGCRTGSSGRGRGVERVVGRASSFATTKVDGRSRGEMLCECRVIAMKCGAG